MIKVTSVFLNNLFIESSVVLTLASTTLGSVYTDSVIFDNFKDNLSFGTALTSVGTNVVLGLDITGEPAISKLQDMQVYVESLTENELIELISKLESKEYFDDSTEMLDFSKVKDKEVL